MLQNLFLRKGPTCHPTPDVSPYFKTDSATSGMMFVGKTLEVRIPRRFLSYGALLIGDGEVTTPGICDLIIDNQYRAGLNILAQITIAPSDLRYMMYKGIEYLVLELHYGDLFMTSTRVLQDDHIIYILWTEFVTRGKCPYFISYTGLLGLFARVKELTGKGIGVSRSVYESIIAHLSRDIHRVSLQYRLTDMTEPSQLVALDSVSQAPTGTISRLNGSYFTTEGVTSALRRQVDEQQPFENILRGISSSVDESPTTAVE